MNKETIKEQIRVLRERSHTIRVDGCGIGGDPFSKEVADTLQYLLDRDEKLEKEKTKLRAVVDAARGCR